MGNPRHSAYIFFVDYGKTSEEIRRQIEEQKGQGLLTVGDGGELFTHLYYLRGFENLLYHLRILLTNRKKGEIENEEWQ